MYLVFKRRVPIPHTGEGFYTKREKRMRQIHTPKPLLYPAFLILNFEF
jgi:hypothetical protein